MVEKGEYKGHPVITLRHGEKEGLPFTFGLNKARLILENIEEIKKFVEEGNNIVKAPKSAEKDSASSKHKGLLGIAAFRNVDEDTIAKILALKPYCLKCELSEGVRIEQNILLAQKELEKCLESDLPEILVHRLFFLIVIAELSRENNPISYREEAAKIGARLAELGKPNPFIYYMKIVEHTTNISTTEDFGDFTASRKNSLNSEELVSESAGKVLGFAVNELSPKAKKFLFISSISDLIKECGLN